MLHLQVLQFLLQLLLLGLVRGLLRFLSLLQALLVPGLQVLHLLLKPLFRGFALLLLCSSNGLLRTAVRLQSRRKYAATTTEGGADTPLSGGWGRELGEGCLRPIPMVCVPKIAQDLFDKIFNK